MVWTKLSIAMLCFWSMGAWAADPRCSSRGTPALTFEWLPKNEAEPSVLGSVQIKDASGNIVQVLDNLENYYYEEGSEYFDTDTDFNNDGCADLVLTNAVGAPGNRSSTALLYNPKARRFEVSEALSKITNLSLDSHDKNCVNESWTGGGSFYSARHCWNKGKLVLMSESSGEPLFNDEGKFLCYQHVDTNYHGGKKRKRTKCTKELDD